MKIILFSRPVGKEHRERVAKIFSVIDSYGFEYMVNEEFTVCVEELIGRTIPTEMCYGHCANIAAKDAVMVCYGGDGTLLEGVHRLEGSNIPVVGINSGRLGFLALAQCDEIESVFERIANRSLNIEQRSMLAVTGNFDGKIQTLFALNEVAVQRLGATMISVEILIDRKPTLTCNGDGVIVSTPTGSTAYSLSAGGPIVSPACRCFVITPLSPHNLTMRSVVAPDNSSVLLKVHTRSNEASISIDNRTLSIADGEQIEVKIAERSISLAVPHNISFYDSLRNKMMWGKSLY